MKDPVWGKLAQINALRSLWLDVVKLPITGILLKNEVLYIYFAHPAFLQEWRIGEQRYMEDLREAYRQRELKKIAVFRKIQVQVRVYQERSFKEEKQEFYEERAALGFECRCTHPRLKAIFETISENIRRKNDTKAKNLS